MNSLTSKASRAVSEKAVHRPHNHRLPRTTAQSAQQLPSNSHRSTSSSAGPENLIRFSPLEDSILIDERPTNSARSDSPTISMYSSVTEDFSLLNGDPVNAERSIRRRAPFQDRCPGLTDSSEDEDRPLAEYRQRLQQRQKQRRNPPTFSQVGSSNSNRNRDRMQPSSGYGSRSESSSPQYMDAQSNFSGFSNRSSPDVDEMEIYDNLPPFPRALVNFPPPSSASSTATTATVDTTINLLDSPESRFSPDRRTIDDSDLVIASMRSISPRGNNNNNNNNDNNAGGSNGRGSPYPSNLLDDSSGAEGNDSEIEFVGEHRPSSGTMNRIRQFEADEQLARRLQEEYDREELSHLGLYRVHGRHGSRHLQRGDEAGTANLDGDETGPEILRNRDQTRPQAEFPRLRGIGVAIGHGRPMGRQPSQMFGRHGRHLQSQLHRRNSFDSMTEDVPEVDPLSRQRSDSPIPDELSGNERHVRRRRSVSPPHLPRFVHVHSQDDRDGAGPSSAARAPSSVAAGPGLGGQQPQHNLRSGRSYGTTPDFAGGRSPLRLGSGGGGPMGTSRGRRRPQHVPPPERIRNQLLQLFQLHFTNSLDMDHMSYESLLDLAEQIGDSMEAGLSAAQINRLPVVKYAAPVQIGAAEFEMEEGAFAAPAPSNDVAGFFSDRSCGICITEYEADEDLRLLPCFHRFHVQCIDIWLKRRVTCPICRVDARRTE